MHQQREKIQYECFKKMEMKQSIFPIYSQMGKTHRMREKRITLAKYFNNRLMNADGRFAKDIDYIFFSQYLSEELKQVIDNTQISIRKSSVKTKQGTKVTANMLHDPEILKEMFKSDEALRFLQPISGTPSFWQSVQKDLFAMFRQLGIPTWFCSFSPAEFR